MKKPQMLTKSRFKTGCSCPTKLYYKNHPESYLDTSSENAFLKALADGGFQVGELAKIYRPEGIEVKTKNKQQALAETNELLKQEKVTIFEAAVQFKNLFIRIDILEKNGKKLKLIEAKAKSYHSNQKDFFNKKPDKDGNPIVSADWRDYFLDVAFQAQVVQHAFPSYQVIPHILLVNKDSVATMDGLNQNFLIVSSPTDGDLRVRVKPGFSASVAGNAILELEEVATEVKAVQRLPFQGRTFLEQVDYLSKLCAEDRLDPPVLEKDCKACEFRAPAEALGEKKSGFVECMTALGVKEEDALRRPFAFDIWNYRGADKALAKGKKFADELSEDDFGEAKETDGGLSSQERQLLQVEYTKSKKTAPYFDKELGEVLQSVTYPLNFIDFETSMAAIPFHQGRRPYEQLAFQFSHHVMEADGSVRHLNQYINLERGKFPNFAFLRALKAALSVNNGSIFRYATHENTVLRQIRAQLEDSAESDKAELIEFIDTVTQWGEKKSREAGPRNMIDLLEWVKRYYYHPAMGGSNSIKKVLPAMLSHSAYLKKKYGSPVYGSEDMPSLNLKPQAWVVEKDGKIQDPYKLLPPVFADLTVEEIEEFLSKEEDEIREGGAAMTAWARIQFTEMPQTEVDRLAKALLRYCELDTLAMVMIFECFREEGSR